ncbi:class I SAM-dependent DNA methyltransferase [Pelagibacterium halotolerans]|uniref:class I SAM-dependent DNA methyltransferase n=1 Tax=Pelagibacterium halotolerans TaxID=531813 RepID=UPI003850DE7E
MDAVFLSSGDLIADRRSQYAKMLAESGDFAAAAELMAQALESVPDWAAGWMMLGGYWHEAGDTGAAIAAWQEAAARDPEGTLGAQMRLAAHGVGDLAPEAQEAYVEALFDAYAKSFEESLVGKLDYVVPDLLFGLIGEAMEAAGVTGFARALDLGCGTGLMGERVRALVSHLSGVDLSAGMVAETARKGVYDAVEQGDLLSFLAGSQGQADLITAADVFLYCGELPPIFAAAHDALVPGGLLVFSLEKHAGEEACVLQPSLRYAHGRTAVEEALRVAGFDIVRIVEDTIRTDRGVPVTGLLVVAQRPVVASVAFLADGEIAEEAPALH